MVLDQGLLQGYNYDDSWSLTNMENLLPRSLRWLLVGDHYVGFFKVLTISLFQATDKRVCSVSGAHRTGTAVTLTTKQNDMT